jgi:ribosomal protein S18 acetylase RimI-like enzyme
VRLAAPHGLIYATADFNSTALWVPPGKWHLSVPKQLSLIPDYVRALGWSGLGPKVKAIQAVQDEHPHDKPYYYLFALGTEPAHQRKGLGTALLRHFHPRVDAEKIGCYLETARESNVAMYERHGYRVVKHYHPVPQSPPLWLMWRDPKG